MGTVVGGAIGGVVGTVVGEVAKLAIVQVTAETPSTAMTVVAAVVGAGIGGAAQEAVQIRRSDRPPGQGTGTARAVTGLVVIIALAAVGAFGASNLLGKVTGNQTGVERLAGPHPTVQEGPLQVTVLSLVDTPDFVKVKVRVVNRGSIPITLFLWSSCQLIGSDGTATAPFGGLTGLGDDIDVPGQGTAVTRVITFRAQPPAEPITLSFSRIFGPGFEVPDTVVIKGIRLIHL